MSTPAAVAPMDPAPAPAAASPAPSNPGGGIMQPVVPAVAPGLATGTDWQSGLNDDMKGFVHTKGFKDPAGILDSYRNLEKLMGAPRERLVTVPEKSDDPAWSDVYAKMGRPADPKEYNIKPGEGQTEDPVFTDWAKKSFHEAGLSKRQAELISNKWNEQMGAMQKAQLTEYTSGLEKQETDLKKEWGLAYNDNVAMGQRAAKAFGIPADTISTLEKAMGFGGVMKLMHTLGSKIGEASFLGPDSGSAGFGGGNLTPQQAQYEIKALRNDPGFQRDYVSGNKDAVQKWDRLHAMAYPGSSSNE